MNLDGCRPLAEVVAEVMDALDGRAPIGDIVNALEGVATHREWTTWATAAVAKSVRDVLRSKDATGVPRHYAVDGEYVAVRLFSVVEYEAVAMKLARSARADRDQVLRLRDRCAEVNNGQTFDADALLRSVGLSA
jgi:hypothetical protein